ncbi:8-amino-7-oxononanoate synthase [Halosquirtibacter laminarini]|uniref:8-amino-7-oxononanoate synthase n=1 Tax=Halosquirtibacter laminarini TaxID=3374600 RepID=A0AC61NDW2_9BACT|nr:8-amino-7-oxononanoate synthase [Prolixibacteraceae bacterium]
MKERLHNKIQQLIENDNCRVLPEPPNKAIELSSNDYMGIGQNISLQRSFFEQLSKDDFVMGACSSRLLTGNHLAFKSLENLLQSLYKKEECMLYNSGYHANIGILPTLTTKRDLIISDQFIHASILDGIKLSEAQKWRFRHNNYTQLSQYLENHRKEYDQVIIVVESIYSMDGDHANLKELVEIKNRFHCLLYVDEAHAFGVTGKYGLGNAEEEGIIQEIDFIIGTFGKAISSQGAFVVCDKIFKTWLTQKSRSLIYTTALPEINIRWSQYVIEYLYTKEDQRKRLQNLARDFAKRLNVVSDSHIIPYLIGSNEHAMLFSERLAKYGISSLPIRHPTVPKGTARLRLSLTSTLTEQDLSKVIDTLKTIQV